jgi:nucleoside-diphosphate-sugar epimerase
MATPSPRGHDRVDTVLVTGGTGFIARWCIVRLLEAGYEVRATVRSAGREVEVRSAIAEQISSDGRVSFALADLTDDEGWAAATSGCRYVLHPASPLGGRSAEAMLAAARDGTERVLRAALDAGVERVVMTSAANAASPTSYREPGITDETLWTDPNAPGLDAYRRSKTLAEKAAWAFVESAGGARSLTTILPGAVLGPILGTGNLGSVQVVGRLLRGDMHRVPRIGLEVVDVRDVADIHLRAMASPLAAGQRFLATGELLWMPDMARLLRNELGGAASRVPTRTVPDPVVRLMARRRPELRGVLPGLGRRNRHSTAKARTMLGWQPRPASEAVLACARSLFAHGVA